MSKELILDSLKASLELLEQVQENNSIGANWLMHDYLGQSILRLQQKILAPYLLDQVIKLVVHISEKRRVALAPQDSLELEVSIGSEYDDNGYSFGIAGESCSVTFTSCAVDERESDYIEQDSWDWIYSLEPSYLSPWMRNPEEGTVVVKILNLNEFYAKIKEGSGSVTKEVFYKYVTIRL